MYNGVQVTSQFTVAGKRDYVFIFMYYNNCRCARQYVWSCLLHTATVEFACIRILHVYSKTFTVTYMYMYLSWREATHCPYANTQCSNANIFLLYICRFKRSAVWRYTSFVFCRNHAVHFLQVSSVNQYHDVNNGLVSTFDLFYDFTCSCIL